MGASIERDMFKNIFEWGDTLQCEGHLSRVRLTPSLKGKEKKGTLTKIVTGLFPLREGEEGNPDQDQDQDYD